MELSWNNQMSIGNATIDSDHRKLLIMVDGVVHAIRKKECDALPHALNALEDHLYAHFVNEEKIAQAINFPFSKQKQAQQFSLKELQNLKDELIAKECSWSESASEHYANFLSSWAIDEHISKLDMPMKPALQKYPYDFLPE